MACGAADFRAEGDVGGWLWGIARRQVALFLRLLRRRGPFRLLAVPVPAEAVVANADSGGLSG